MVVLCPIDWRLRFALFDGQPRFDGALCAIIIAVYICAHNGRIKIWVVQGDMKMALKDKIGLMIER